MSRPEKGSTLPRLWTKPLPGREEGEGCVPDCSCGLTRQTSRGWDVIDWVELELELELLPWQKWLLIHSLELDEACAKLRHRKVLVLVARQNGKTTVKGALTLYRMFELNTRYVVGTAQDLSQAAEVMNEDVIPMILRRPKLMRRFNPEAPLHSDRIGQWSKQNAATFFRLDVRWHAGRGVFSPDNPRYLVKALNRKAGRGMNDVGEVNIDELREQRDWAGWAAITPTVTAASGPQIWCMSNAGDRESVVLNQLRSVAMSGDDPTLFHAEWSAPELCELDDREAWAAANPSLGYTLGWEALESSLATDPPAVFRTEVLCQSVDILETAIDFVAWESCADPAGRAMGRPSLCYGVAESGHTVCVAATGLESGRTRLELVGEWKTTEAAREAAKGLRELVNARTVSWWQKGPESVLASVLRKTKGVPLMQRDTTEACMTLADYVASRKITHGDDHVLNQGARSTGATGTGSAWYFDRSYWAHGLWAAAGALHAHLQQPDPVKARRDVIV